MNAPILHCKTVLFISAFAWQLWLSCEPKTTNTESTLAKIDREGLAVRTTPKTDTVSPGARVQEVVPGTPAEDNNNTANLQSLIDELADHRIMEFSRYNSGNGGEGMRSERYMDLCSNGSYTYHFSSTISIGDHISQDVKDEHGSWRVYENSGTAMIRFTPSDGPESETPVSFEDGKLFINGRRAYHIPKGQNYGPESCN